MILSTTFVVDGYTQKNHTFISSEVVIGANVFKDFFASLTNFFGGRSASYEKALIEGKNKAMDEIIQKAESLGANGIVGVDMAYDVVGRK
jgi:uncharacterized protein YbjQ (UPF0145 family)